MLRCSDNPQSNLLAMLTRGRMDAVVSRGLVRFLVQQLFSIMPLAHQPFT